MNQMRSGSSTRLHERASPKGEGESFVLGFHGVRYQVKDVSRSVAFYTKQLGFKLNHQQLPALANVSLGNLEILLSRPGSSGSRPCRTVITKNPVGGTEWSFGWQTFRRELRH